MNETQLSFELRPDHIISLRPEDHMVGVGGNVGHRQLADHGHDIIDMTNDKERGIKEYDEIDFHTLHTSIVRPKIDAAQFKFKPIMF